MKKLLLLLTVFGGFLSANAKGLVRLINITANGTLVAPAINGSYFPACNRSQGAEIATPLGLWYKYTASANGLVTISSNLTTNVAPKSNDTRLSVFVGTCAALTCEAGNDDVSGLNYLSSVTFPVTTGTTYYIFNGIIDGMQMDLILLLILLLVLHVRLLLQ